ncbi:hypothetical protein Tco_1393973 [Tanacetum coccineum]
MKDFEGMSYAEIRPIFEKVWDYNHNFVPMDLDIEKEKKNPAEFQQIEKEQYPIVVLDVLHFVRKYLHYGTTKSSEEMDAQRITDLIHILLMQNGIAIHMLTEKKYPLSQEMISEMLNKRLEIDHESTQAYELLKVHRSQVQK